MDRFPGLEREAKPEAELVFFFLVLWLKSERYLHKLGLQESLMIPAFLRWISGPARMCDSLFSEQHWILLASLAHSASSWCWNEKSFPVRQQPTAALVTANFSIQQKNQDCVLYSGRFYHNLATNWAKIQLFKSDVACDAWLVWLFTVLLETSNS